MTAELRATQDDDNARRQPYERAAARRRNVPEHVRARAAALRDESRQGSRAAVTLEAERLRREFEREHGPR
ncbi:hypothetical protein [Luteitalea sp.]